MPDIIIRDVDERVLAFLKEEANREGRSLQKALHGWLTAKSERLQRHREAVSALEAMEKETQKGRKGKPFPDSTALIRESRRKDH